MFPQMIPLVVITGFLGAGKTTLVNRLLARRAARGAAPGTLGLIVNELGEVGIDGALLGGAGRQVELPGGCVCCVLGDDLARTLDELCASERRLEVIVLETTGVAEPIGIAWAIEAMGSGAKVRLAAVVTLVDATCVVASRPASPAVDAQLAYADAVLVTKVALATPAELAGARALIAELVPRAQVRDGDVDAHAAWLEALLEEPTLDRVGQVALGGDHHVHDAGCGHAHGIDSVWLAIDGVIDLEALEDELAALPSAYLRIKGIARAIDGRTGEPAPRWVAFHRVGLRVSSEPLPAGDDARVVALGPGVTLPPLAACVRAARVEVAA
jgi:G3E family GTPase